MTERHFIREARVTPSAESARLVRFRLEPVELTVHAAVTRTGTGSAGVRWHVLALGGERSRQVASAQTLVLRLSPVVLGPGGKPLATDEQLVSDVDDAASDAWSPGADLDDPVGDAGSRWWMTVAGPGPGFALLGCALVDTSVVGQVGISASSAGLGRGHCSCDLHQAAARFRTRAGPPSITSRAIQSEQSALLTPSGGRRQLSHRHKTPAHSDEQSPEPCMPPSQPRDD